MSVHDMPPGLSSPYQNPNFNWQGTTGSDAVRQAYQIERDMRDLVVDKVLEAIKAIDDWVKQHILPQLSNGLRSSIDNGALTIVKASFDSAESKARNAGRPSDADKIRGGRDWTLAAYRKINPISNHAPILCHVNWANVNDREAFDRWWSYSWYEMQQYNVGKWDAYAAWQDCYRDG